MTEAEIQAKIATLFTEWRSVQDTWIAKINTYETGGTSTGGDLWTGEKVQSMAEFEIEPIKREIEYCLSLIPKLEVVV